MEIYGVLKTKFSDPVKNERLVKKKFWLKIKNVAGKIPFSHEAVSLYFCAMDPNTPTKAKISILAALAYFITPLDCVLDAIPGIGFADDASVILGVLKILSSQVTDEHKEKAEDFFEVNLEN